MVAERDTYGFVVEVNEKNVKFITLERGFLELPIDTDETIPELSEPHLIEADQYSPLSNLAVPDFQISVRDGVVHAQLFAIGPNLFQLPKEIRNKFRNVVWSPHLKYMNDKNGVFADAVKGGEVAKVLAKYSPSEGGMFEIVEVVVWEEEPDEARLSIYHQNPWTIETLAFHTKPVHAIVPGFLGSINRTKSFGSNERAIGVCIAHREPNPLWKETNEKYGEAFMSLLWSPKFGLTRWMIRKHEKNEIDMNSENYKEEPEDEVHERATKVLGHWFAYSLNDVRHNTFHKMQYEENEYQQLSKYVTSATDVLEVDVEKPFQVVQKPNVNGDGIEYVLEMEVSFGFRRTDFIKDDLLNRDEPISPEDIEENAHFIDLELGRVEIHPASGALILHKIDQHHEEMRRSNPDEFEQRKNEAMIVTATVIVMNCYHRNAAKYPERGLFLVQSVDRIFYLHGGATIWKREE